MLLFCQWVLSLQPLGLDIFLAWKSLNVIVSVIYLPRSDPRIEFADFHSRNFDLHDYSLDFDNFLFVSSIFGPLDVDCFASDSNKNLSVLIFLNIQMNFHRGSIFLPNLYMLMLIILLSLLFI